MNGNLWLCHAMSYDLLLQTVAHYGQDLSCISVSGSHGCLDPKHPVVGHTNRRPRCWLPNRQALRQWLLHGKCIAALSQLLEAPRMSEIEGVGCNQDICISFMIWKVFRRVESGFLQN